MTDWGCPNWKDISAYGSYTDWSQEQWRWEFKRRSANVRSIYIRVAMDEFRLNFPKGILSQILIWEPKYKKLIYTLSPALAVESGYPALPNPIYSELPDDYHFFKKRNFELRTIRGWSFEAVKRGKADWIDFLGVTGIGIVFNPNEPIAPQLEGLSEYLLSLRNHSLPNDMQRAQKDKWIRYLRILDAREDKASWSKCAKYILPSSVAQTAQAARDTHKQAKLLQDRL